MEVLAVAGLGVRLGVENSLAGRVGMGVLCDMRFGENARALSPPEPSSTTATVLLASVASCRLPPRTAPLHFSAPQARIVLSPFPCSTRRHLRRFRWLRPVEVTAATTAVAVVTGAAALATTATRAEVAVATAIAANIAAATATAQTPSSDRSGAPAPPGAPATVVASGGLLSALPAEGSTKRHPRVRPNNTACEKPEARLEQELAAVPGVVATTGQITTRPRYRFPFQGSLHVFEPRLLEGQEPRKRCSAVEAFGRGEDDPLVLHSHGHACDVACVVAHLHPAPLPASFRRRTGV